MLKDRKLVYMSSTAISRRRSQLESLSRNFLKFNLLLTRKLIVYDARRLRRSNVFIFMELLRTTSHTCIDDDLANNIRIMRDTYEGEGAEFALSDVACIVIANSAFTPWKFSTCKEIASRLRMPFYRVETMIILSGSESRWKKRREYEGV